jgi:hypothetical protein
MATRNVDMAKHMNLAHILQELHAERDRLDRAIESLEKLVARRVLAPESAEAPRRRGRKSMSAAERKEVSRRMKEYWRSRRE